MWDELGSRSPRQRIIKPPLITRYPPPDEPRISWVRVAGRYLGYDGWSPQQAAVLDRVTGELVYRLPDDTSLGALQADGKVAACHQGRLVWFSPQEPSPHPVPGVRGCHQIIALEDDVVAWRDDDGRFAFRRDHCVITANLASAQENGPRDGGACPVRILSARLTRGGLAIRIRCPDGCRGSVEPRVPVLSRARPTAGRPRCARTSSSPATARTITYRDRRLRRRLAGTRTLRLRVRHLSRRAGRTLQEIRRVPLGRQQVLAPRFVASTMDEVILTWAPVAFLAGGAGVVAAVFLLVRRGRRR